MFLVSTLASPSQEVWSSAVTLHTQELCPCSESKAILGLTLQHYVSYLSSPCCKDVLFACQITPIFLLRRPKEKKIASLAQLRRGSRARSLISDWPRPVGRLRSRSQPELCKLGLALWPVSNPQQELAGSGFLLCLCELLLCLAPWATREKDCFSWHEQILWKCFQAFGRTVWKYPISIFRFPSLFSYMILSSINKYCFLLNPFGSKIFRIIVFVFWFG